MEVPVTACIRDLDSIEVRLSRKAAAAGPYIPRRYRHADGTCRRSSSTEKLIEDKRKSQETL